MIDLPLFTGKPQTVEEPPKKPAPEATQPFSTCRVCFDTGSILDDGRYKFCTCETGQKQKLLQTCAMLSNGTLATLTNCSRYEELDKIRRLFLDFVSAKGKGEWTWQKAWKAFSEENPDVCHEPNQE